MRFASRLLALAALAAGILIGRQCFGGALAPHPPGNRPPGGPADDDVERRLDEALEETFPASDPIAVRIE